MGMALLCLCGCTPAQVATVTQTGLPAPSATPLPSTTVQPSPTPEWTETPTFTPTPTFEISSPLQGIAVDELSALITNPYNPPEPGSDDPHMGIDLSDMLPGTQMAVAGRIVQAVLAGQVAGVNNDRFPYGSAVMIETPLSALPADWVQAIQPAEAPAPVMPISLSCPNGIPWLEGQTGQSLYVLYAHLEQPPLPVLDSAVSAGEAIGAVGMSGNALNPHVHVEMRVGPSGARFASMAHYDASASLDEMTAYCQWRVGGQFQLIDPMKLFILNP